MLQDSQCNKVYFSEWLRDEKGYQNTFHTLIATLDKHKVEWGVLPDTNDIWCRDYMPVQVAPGRFIAYTYNPDYLRNNQKEYITDGKIPFKSTMGMEPCSDIADLVIDGGNVIRAGDYVIMTAKVFEENPHIRPAELCSRLENAFGAGLIVVPWDAEHEEFGHSDGLCRYIGHNTLLLTNYAQFDSRITERFKNILSRFFTIEELQYKNQTREKDARDYSWAYINFIQTDKVIILPSLGIELDAEAKEKFSAFMPEYKGRIEMVAAMDFIKKGKGGFNCCSWTIKQ